MAAGHACLTHIVQGTVYKILAAHAIKPQKVRYYLERRDEAFETKMAEVLCVYREVAILKESESAPADLAIISYDEKPGIQAIGNTAPDLPPQPGTHPTFARDHEYKRHGTLSLLAGIDLLTGRVHARVEDRHRSREFVAFLRQLDAAYPADTAIRLILDNHSAHISKETKAWVATQPEGRFAFVFTPKHGSWLNLIEGFFSKLARSMLRHIRVASKDELRFMRRPSGAPNRSVMIGASSAAFPKYQPLFEVIAANMFHVGPSGAGATAELVTQYLGYTNFIASIEGMLVAAKGGIRATGMRAGGAAAWNAAPIGDLDILAKIAPGKVVPSTTLRATSVPRRRWARSPPTSTSALS